jgi:hypothetical protein
MMPAKVAQPTVQDVVDAIDKVSKARSQRGATREQIADYLGVDADEISEAREPTLLLGQALEHGYIEEDRKPRGYWRLTSEGLWVLGQ